MATSHAFNFTGGVTLSEMGATWFVSYTYHCYIDNNHKNWLRVSTFDSRRSIWRRSSEYHLFWLQQIVRMNDNKLNTNQIGLRAYQTKMMAQELLLNGLEQKLETVTSRNNKSYSEQYYGVEVGKSVVHNKYGVGKIVFVNYEKIEIQFALGDKRTFVFPEVFKLGMVKVQK